MTSPFGDLASFLPALSAEMQSLIRSAYGWLLLATLLMALPHARRFFMSERWGGYAESKPSVDRIQNPILLPGIFAAWIACAALLAVGQLALPAAALNFLLCRYFFVSMRWNGVLRGMGAPGFMTYWLGAAVLFLELTGAHAPQVAGPAILVFQVDFALIMMSAGVYKLTAGYAQNHGMELGLANPQWGYWWRWYVDLPPGHRIFRIMNHLAWSTEIVSAVLMLIPQTRMLGAILIILSFAFIATQIRLGFLCEMVVVSAFLFFEPGLAGSQWPDAITSTGSAQWSWTSLALATVLWGYLVLLPLAHACLFYNFYARRSLAWPLQRALEAYTNFFGIIIWRVFSVDHTNFCIFIHRRDAASPDRRVTITEYGSLSSLRFAQVGESITITSLFTTLKYYPGNDALFRTRLLRYARTLPCPPGSTLIFEYVSVVKETDRFALVPVTEFLVDPQAGKIEERRLSDVVSIRAAHAASPVHEAARPGTYAPSVS